MQIKKSQMVRMIEKEHENLKHYMESLNREVTGEVISQDFSDWKLKFIWKLRDFKNQLLKHFELEEEGGFTEEILMVKPQNHSKIKRLEGEHKQIVSQLEEIICDLKNTDVKNISTVGGIKERVNKLLETIRSHEAAERDLIQTTYLQDHGPVD